MILRFIAETNAEYMIESLRYIDHSCVSKKRKRQTTL